MPVTISTGTPDPTEYVLGFVFNNSEERVVLIQKTKPAWQNGKLNGVGGKLEAGETPEVAMIREYKEETGVDHDTWHRFAVLRGPTWIVHTFCAFDEAAASGARTTESELVVVANPHKLPESVHWNLRWLIPLALDPDNLGVVDIMYPAKDT